MKFNKTNAKSVLIVEVIVRKYISWVTIN